MLNPKGAGVAKQLEYGLKQWQGSNIEERIDKIDEAYGELVKKYHGVIPTRLVCARIEIESNGNPKVVARPQKWQTGFGSELGLLQLSPDTRHQYHVTDEEAFDPEINIRIGCKVWNAWANKFFKETLGSPPEPTEDDIRGTWAWLVTAIGPGAVRRLRKLNSNSYDLDGLMQIVSTDSIMKKNKGFWGSQDVRTIAKRVGVAIALSRICARRMPFDVEKEEREKLGL